MSDWKDVIKAVSPGIAGLLGGPLAATAVQALSQALLGKPDGTEAEVAAIAVSGSPEALTRIKEAETSLKTALANAGVRLDEIAAGDRDSARRREIGTKDNTTKILAYCYTVGYFVMTATLLKTVVNEDMKDIVIALISIMSAAQLNIVNYYFGSSRSSAEKSNLIDRLSR